VEKAGTVGDPIVHFMEKQRIDAEVKAIEDAAAVAAPALARRKSGDILFKGGEARRRELGGGLGATGWLPKSATHRKVKGFHFTSGTSLSPDEAEAIIMNRLSSSYLGPAGPRAMGALSEILSGSDPDVVPPFFSTKGGHEMMLGSTPREELGAVTSLSPSQIDELIKGVQLNIGQAAAKSTEALGTFGEKLGDVSLAMGTFAVSVGDIKLPEGLTSGMGPRPNVLPGEKTE
jgi:hypothetical protein